MGCILDSIDDMYDDYKKLCKEKGIKPIHFSFTVSGLSWSEHYKQIR